MALIRAEDQARLRERFSRELSGDVRLRLETHRHACEACDQTGELLDEIVSLSDMLVLERREGDDELPATSLEGAARGALRFLGIPSGYELPAFIDSIVDCSRGETSLGRETVERLARVTNDVRLMVFTTPT